MPKPVDQSCLTCKYFTPNAVDDPQGICQRYPDIATIFAPGETPSGLQHTQAYADHWCGEFHL